MNYFVLDVIIAFLVYMTFPTMYLYVNGKVPRKQANKIALINSLICLVIFCFIRAGLTGGKDIIGNSFAPATLYFFIASAMLTDKTVSKKENEVKEKQQNENAKPNNEEKPISNAQLSGGDGLYKEEDLYNGEKPCNSSQLENSESEVEVSCNEQDVLQENSNENVRTESSNEN